MEEIIKELKESYSLSRSERKPTTFKLYSNMIITQPVKKQAEFRQRVERGVEYLMETEFNHKLGFQSKPSKSENGQVHHADGTSTAETHPENYTNLLAFILLSEIECDDDLGSSHIIDTILKSLRSIISADYNGISTCNIFTADRKQVKVDSKCLDAVVVPPMMCPSSSSDDGVDSGRSSSLLLNSVVDAETDDLKIYNEGGISLTPSLCFTNKQSSEDEEEDVVDELFLVADDISTTALTLSILMQEDMMDVMPCRSVTQILLANASARQSANNGVCDSEDDNNLEQHGVIRNFLDNNGDEEDSSPSDFDAGCWGSLLYLYYLLNQTLDFDENVAFTENYMLNFLHKMHKVDDLLLEEYLERICNFHKSSDLALYFLARVAAISEAFREKFKQPLTWWLERRIGKSQSSLDISARILAAFELDLLSQDGHMIRNKLREDCEVLASLQNESNGAWPSDTLFKISINKKLIEFEGAAISTLFSVTALSVWCATEQDFKHSRKLYTNFLY